MPFFYDQCKYGTLRRNPINLNYTSFIILRWRFDIFFTVLCIPASGVAMICFRINFQTDFIICFGDKSWLAMKKACFEFCLSPCFVLILKSIVCEITAGRSIGVVLLVACKTHTVTRMLHSISALTTSAVGKWASNWMLFGVFIESTAGNLNAQNKVHASLWIRCSFFKFSGDICYACVSITKLFFLNSMTNWAVSTLPSCYSNTASAYTNSAFWQNP